MKPDGRFGMIVSSRWMRARYGEKLRCFVKGFQVLRLVDFGELKVFEGSATFPLVMTMVKRPPTTKPIYSPIKRLDFDDLEDEADALGFELDENALSPAGFALVQRDAAAILEKMNTTGVPLGEYVDNRINRGIVTGFNKAFVIDKGTRERLIAEDPASEELIRPFVIGDDIRKYRVNWRERYLIFTRRGVDIEEYPAIRDHLSQWKAELTPKADRNAPIGRKPGEYQWYEIQDTVSYYPELEKPKIVWPEIAMESRFAWDDRCYHCNKTCFIMSTDDPYLLGVLNSRLVWMFLKRICPVLGDPDERGRLTQQAVYVKQIPIIRIRASNRRESRSKKQIHELVQQILTLQGELAEAFSAIQKRRLQDRITDAEREIDRLVYGLYGLTDGEIGIVEDSV